MPPEGKDVTRLLLAWRGGDPGALDRLIPVVYAELRRLAHRQMRGERSGHPLQTTALELRYFGGLSIDQTAEALGVSPETVTRDWRMAKLWLVRELKGTPLQVPAGRR